MDLSSDAVASVKEIAKKLKTKKFDVARIFHKTLYSRYPNFQALFSENCTKTEDSEMRNVPTQLISLSHAFIAYATRVDEINAFTPVTDRICHKHVAHGIQPSQYEAVGECLLHAIRHVLGNNVSDEHMAAWTEAYNFVSRSFISAEQRLKAELVEFAGFDGMVNMRVGRKDDKLKTMKIIPTEYHVPFYKDGQFVAVSDGLSRSIVELVDIGTNGLIIRIFDLYQTPVKMLIDASEGDILEVSMPCGKSRCKI